MLGRLGRFLVLAVTVGSLLGACTTDSPEALVQRAEQSIAAKQYKTATIDLRAALQQDPKNLRARWLLGDVYLTLEDGPSAEKELRRASELGVEDDSVMPLLARALLLQGKTDDVLALPSLGLSAAAAGELASSRARAFLGKGEPGNARREIDSALNSAQSSPHVGYALARVLVAERLPDQALAQLDSVQEGFPDYAAAWTLRGDILAKRREFAQAEDAYTKAIANSVAPSKAILQRGFARLAQGKVGEASADAAVSLKVAPGSSGAQYLAGLTYQEKGELPAAQEALQNAYSASPNNQAIVRSLASTELALGNINSARGLAEKALALAPNDSSSRKLMAQIHLLDRKGREAEFLLALLVASEPADLQAKRLLARSLYIQGKTSEGAQLSAEVAAQMQDSPSAQAQAGIGLMASGATAEGIVALEKAVELAPEEQSLNALLIAGYMDKGQGAEAVAAAEKFSQSKPGDAEALNLLAFTYLAEGDIKKAKAVFEKTLQRDPANRAAARTLASLELADGDAGAARTHLRPALQAFPDDVRLLSLMADAARQEGEFEEMESLLNKVVEADASNEGARALLARRFLEKNEAEKALRVLAPIDSPKNRDVLLIRAESLYRLARLDDAKRELETLTRRAPGSLQAHFALARVYDDLGDEAGLARELDLVLKLSPEDARAGLARARLLAREGQFAAAEELLDGIDLPANDPRVLAARLAVATSAGRRDAAAQYAQRLFAVQATARNAVMLSRAQAKAGQADASIRTIDGWLAAHPQDVQVITELANRYLAQQRLDDYFGQLRRILDVDPTNVFALNNLAWHLRKTSPAEALGYARRAYEKMPDSPAVIDTLAIVLAENGDYEAALRMIAKAIDLAADQAMFRVHRAEIRFMAGDKERATAELKALLQEPISELVRKQAEAQLRRTQG